MRQVRNQIPTRPDESQKIGTLERDPAMHYVRVEKESPKSDYVSPMEEMLAQGYTIASEARADTGHSKFSLLQIPKEIYDEQQRANEAEAKASEARPSGPQDRGTWESTEVGSAMTIGQLEASIGKTP